ncbi:MAG: cupin domain-containing protein [Planctomycetota bacterium]|jgi:quercetin dioxygenase-like cupin family protein|nr:cupin domain-containing protein [Planctomycetota bacterium]
MFRLHENDREYRSGNSGPKYLMNGPRMNFAVMRLNAGQDFKAHYHTEMEENFYILDGEVEITVDGDVQRLRKGDFIHIEPNERHFIRNASDQPITMVAALAPHRGKDKVEVEDTGA